MMDLMSLTFFFCQFFCVWLFIYVTLLILCNIYIYIKIGSIYWFSFCLTDWIHDGCRDKMIRSRSLNKIEMVIFIIKVWKFSEMHFIMYFWYLRVQIANHRAIDILKPKLFIRELLRVFSLLQKFNFYVWYDYLRSLSTNGGNWILNFVISYGFQSSIRLFTDISCLKHGDIFSWLLNNFNQR